MPTKENSIFYNVIPGFSADQSFSARCDAAFQGPNGFVDYQMGARYDLLFTPMREGSVDFGPGGGRLVVAPSTSGIQTIVNFDPAKTDIDLSYLCNVTNRKGVSYFGGSNGTFDLDDIQFQDLGSGNWRLNWTGLDPNDFGQIRIQTDVSVTQADLAATLVFDPDDHNVTYTGQIVGNRPLVITGDAGNNIAVGSPYQTLLMRLRAGKDIGMDGFQDDRIFGGSGRDWLYSTFGADRLDGGRHKDTYVVRYDKLVDNIFFTPGDKFIFYGTAPHNDVEIVVKGEHQLDVLIDGQLAEIIRTKPAGVNLIDYLEEIELSTTVVQDLEIVVDTSKPLPLSY